MTLSLAGRLLDKPTSFEDVAWVDFLKARIDPHWRPEEFDFEGLVYVPDPESDGTALAVCARDGCQVRLSSASYCPGCRSEHRRSASPLTVDEWARHAGPRVMDTARTGCDVPECQRSHDRFGICNTHSQAYKKWRRAHTAASVSDWIEAQNPVGLGPRPRCGVGNCTYDSINQRLCQKHANAFRKWRNEQIDAEQPSSRDRFIHTYAEPLYDENGTTFRELNATPFGLLPEPLRWEFLYAVQQRDGTGVLLAPRHVRAVYLHHRRAGTESLVGQIALGFSDAASYKRGMFSEWQRHIDRAYREWSGTDNRDTRVIYLSELELRATSRTIGPNNVIDLRTVEQDWIVDAIREWLVESPRGYDDVMQMQYAWVVASEVLAVRRTPVQGLGPQDMDAVAARVRQRWTSTVYQRKILRALEILLTFARGREQFNETWGRIPARFAVDRARHQVRGQRTNSEADEPFRFVPQPIIEHLMNHLHLLERPDQYRGGIDVYLTAEARAMLFVHERCGRRTGETTKLLDDCISYDDEGAPYLEWIRGKKPYTKGKRLPIHQETHDVIREWQAIKREHGVLSQWLFPNRRTNGRVDKHWHSMYLRARLEQLVDVVNRVAPFANPVQGVEGNLIHFDMSTLDPYSFRHAFAQRFADATDADGRPTTPPDVLQEYMGHGNFNTTMAYFEVSSKRRKKALAGVPPRRLNLLGEVVPVDRERDGFTRVAVSLGHCSEPQNVTHHGHGCMVNHACESCPFFLVDPLEREGMDAKRHALKVQLERARAINAQQHLLDHYEARIKDCTTIIDGIDAYVERLPETERIAIRTSLNSMAEARRLATAPRLINLRTMFQEAETPE